MQERLKIVQSYSQSFSLLERCARREVIFRLLYLQNALIHTLRLKYKTSGLYYTFQLCYRLFINCLMIITHPTYYILFAFWNLGKKGMEGSLDINFASCSRNSPQGRNQERHCAGGLSFEIPHFFKTLFYFLVPDLSSCFFMQENSHLVI